MNSLKQEAWFCYPENGQNFPTAAVIYNYETGAIGHRELPGAAHITTGYIDDSGGVGGVAWDSAVGTWDTYVGPWDQATFNASSRRLLMCDPTNTKFYYADDTNQFNGSNMDAFVERRGLAVVGKDRIGNPRVDLQSRKVLRRIWPKLEGGPVTIKAIVQEVMDGTVTYSPGMSFDPSTQRYVDLPIPLSGLLVGIRVESMANVAWTLHGYDLELEILGYF